jgi:FAD/FMN-containing dehydrogenase
MPAYDLDGLKRRIAGIRREDNPALVRQKSRDFYWYSPVLKRQLERVVADIVVSPASEAELLQAMAACFELRIPITPRGTGTGNYGQAMPLSGGVVLDLSGLNRVRAIAPGRVVAEPGAVLAAIDQQTRPHSGQELRIHPSTYHTASIGGFIAGGSGGVGSIRWGGLRDCGNVIPPPWRRAHACSTSPATSCTRSRTPTAPTASSPKWRCRSLPPMPGST